MTQQTIQTCLILTFFAIVQIHGFCPIRNTNSIERRYIAQQPQQQQQQNLQQQYQNHGKISTSQLYGAFNKRNKQMELRKQFEKAKKAREQLEKEGGVGGDDDGITSSKTVPLSDEEIKKENDMKRFEELLNRDAMTINDLDNGSYLTLAQEEAEAEAGYKGKDRLFEGDPAPDLPFENLISFKTGDALGQSGSKRIVPWLNKSSAKQNDYLVVVTDPRVKSFELRNGMRSLSKGVPADILSKTIVINADSPSENRKWLKKQDLSNLQLYSDEKREWMREYTALGEKRWSITIFVLLDGKVSRLAREVEQVSLSKVVTNAVRSL
eukprot:CAMPEP_0184868404 /NCGR_PEP_ID=MMETSP0580-20130426/30255_1 /TAXON_ID=1118495 /ORGANISM="Dactyliosolen fragilissimus" /LENGTH=323 /DNA_ID=CAMNT_0027369255 /DNA_START=77 /DNA_END=1048 /DNA_ORIENTATION=-